MFTVKEYVIINYIENWNRKQKNGQYSPNFGRDKRTRYKSFLINWKALNCIVALWCWKITECWLNFLGLDPTSSLTNFRRQTSQQFQCTPFAMFKSSLIVVGMKNDRQTAWKTCLSTHYVKNGALRDGVTHLHVTRMTNQTRDVKELSILYSCRRRDVRWCGAINAQTERRRGAQCVAMVTAVKWITRVGLVTCLMRTDQRVRIVSSAF